MPIHSLEPIHKILDTGQRPVVVSCTDFSDYICKYSRNIPANALMTEWICANAARSVGLSIPNFDFVHVLTEHIPSEKIIQLTGSTSFRQPLFGSKYVNAKHVDQMALVLLSQAKRKSKIQDKDELLKIALFDIWIANEDRHQNNYNLMLQEAEVKYQFYVIDHGAAFNSQAAVEREMTPLTWEETIINSPLFEIVYKKPHKFVDRIEKTIDELNVWHRQAKQSLEQWCVSIPPNWGIDMDLWMTFLCEEWLTDKWKEQTKQTFREHLQFYLNP